MEPKKTFYVFMRDGEGNIGFDDDSPLGPFENIIQAKDAANEAFAATKWCTGALIVELQGEKLVVVVTGEEVRQFAVRIAQALRWV